VEDRRRRDQSAASAHRMLNHPLQSPTVHPCCPYFPVLRSPTATHEVVGNTGNTSSERAGVDPFRLDLAVTFGGSCFGASICSSPLYCPQNRAFWLVAEPHGSHGWVAGFHDLPPELFDTAVDRSWWQCYFFRTIEASSTLPCLFQPWKREKLPAFHASRSPGVLRSQSGRISLVTARRSCQRSMTDGRPQNQ
jgi:hypothetical protein